MTLVAAVARNGVIGRDGDLVVRIPADLRRFKALTTGHTLVMGRRTWDSIGRALPGRRTVVVTRDPGWAGAGAERAGSVDAALALAARGGPGGSGSVPEVFVVGGGEIYAQTIDRADALELTEVDAEPAGDTRFPPVDPEAWTEVRREPGEGYDFVRYERRGQAS